METLPVMGDTANDWETSAGMFNTALLRQDAAGLDEGQKYLQNTSFFRGKTH